MATRRSLLLALAAGMLAPRLALAQADPLGRAAEFIRQAGNELAAISGSAKTPEARRPKLEAFIDRVADVDSVARFCAGRYWRQMTPQQQREYLRLFHQVLLNSVSARVNEYEGGTAKVQIGRPVQGADGISVPTTVERSDNPPVHVTWVVSMESGAPKIVDVIAEGMSLRLTQRSDYASFLSRNGNDVGALIQAMTRQAEAR